MTYDGSITINTKVDPANFNKAITKIGDKLTRLGVVINALGLAFKRAFSLAALTLVFGAIFQVFQKITERIKEAISSLFEEEWKNVVPEIESVKGQFAELKIAVSNAFLPLVKAAIPSIKETLSWLVELLNKISMITAAWLGQKQVLQVVQGSGEKWAKSIEKGKRAALGALAAFDQINVLNTDKGAEDPSQSMAAAMTKMVPVTDEVLSQVQAIKDTIASWWADPEGLVKKLWDNVLLLAGNTIMKIAGWLADTWKKIELWVGNTVMKIAGGLSAAWQQIGEWAGIVFSQILQAFIDAWERIKEIAITVLLWIMGEWGRFSLWFRENVTDPIQSIFAGLWEVITQKAADAWQKIVAVWKDVTNWIKTNVTDPIRNIFSAALDWISQKFISIFDTIKSIARGALNSIIDFMNGMISATTNAINSLISGANTLGGNIPGFQIIPTIEAPKIPRLATGAVIPPNSEFLAVLGDQRSGKNIEAPIDLIRQVVSEAVNNASGSQQITIQFAGTLGALVRELKPYIDKENRRVGPSLATRSAA